MEGMNNEMGANGEGNIEHRTNYYVNDWNTEGHVWRIENDVWVGHQQSDKTIELSIEVGRVDTNLPLFAQGYTNDLLGVTPNLQIGRTCFSVLKYMFFCTLGDIACLPTYAVFQLARITLPFVERNNTKFNELFHTCVARLIKERFTPVIPYPCIRTPITSRRLKRVLCDTNVSSLLERDVTLSALIKDCSRLPYRLLKCDRGSSSIKAVDAFLIHYEMLMRSRASANKETKSILKPRKRCCQGDDDCLGAVC